MRGFGWCVKSKIINLCHIILGPFLAPISFIQIWQKNTEVRNFHFWLILVGRASRSKNGRRHIKLMLCCFCPIISPHTKFHPNRTTNAQVRNFHFWSILVGRAGRSKNGRSNLKLILCCFWAILSTHTKFHPNRMKNTEVENFHYWSVLVGRAGRSKNGRSHSKHSIAVWKVINDLCTKFELNRIKTGRVSPFLNFWLVGWLGRSAWEKFETKLWFKA